MATYIVEVPIAGHAFVTVEASSEKEACEKAISAPVSLKDIESWETLKAFHSGNVCYCPEPWTARAELQSDD